MTTADTLPRAHASERYCVGCLVAFPDSAPEIFKLLTERDFVDPFCRAIFAKFAEQWRSGLLDPVLAGRELQASNSLFAGDSAQGLILTLAQDVATSTHVATEAAKIIEARRKRQQIEAFETTAEHLKNGYSAEQGIAEIGANLEEWKRESNKPRDKFTFNDLAREYPQMNPPIVDGLFREGETLNLISASKVGKSWLCYNLALSIITGQPWLDRFDVARPGKVLLLDNELHKPTLAYRIATVANAMSIPPAHYNEDLTVWSLRGNIRSLQDLESEFYENEPGYYQVVILDSKYRFLPLGTSENDNSAETALYNLIDRIADRMQTAFVLIHHSSKGSQSDKRITDVGSGAGAQSRATDTHFILREHQDPGIFVAEAALRSFQPVEPIALHWNFPLWRPDSSADPGKLKRPLPPNEQRRIDKDREGIELIMEKLRGCPATARDLREKTGLSRERQQRLLDWMVSKEHATSQEITKRGNRCREYTLVETDKK